MLHFGNLGVGFYVSIGVLFVALFVIARHALTGFKSSGIGISSPGPLHLLSTYRHLHCHNVRMSCNKHTMHVQQSLNVTLVYSCLVAQNQTSVLLA